MEKEGRAAILSRNYLFRFSCGEWLCRMYNLDSAAEQPGIAIPSSHAWVRREERACSLASDTCMYYYTCWYWPVQ